MRYPVSLRDLKITTFKYLICSGIFACLALFPGGAAAQAVAAPEINCIQTISANTLAIQWISPADPGGNFTAYHIYTSIDPTAPFSLQTSIADINITTYTALFPGGITGDQCYYIITEYDNGGTPAFSAPSETVCSIYLDVSPSAAPQGLAFLDWNNPYPNANVIGTYTILMEYPAGTWTTIGTSPQDVTAFSHEISVCDEFLNFQVIFSTPGHCDHVSNIDGEWLTDLTPPAIPVVTSVSVDHVTNDAVISWEPSASPDCQGYIVYRCLPNGTVALIDTAFGYLNTSFTDILASTTTGPVSYVVAAIDTCYSGIPPSPNTSAAGDCNVSVFLNPIGYAICEDYVQLTWSAYEGWADDVDVYEIFHSFNNGPFEIAEVVTGANLSYQHAVSVGGMNSYYIRARSVTGNYSAVSNLRNVNVVYPPSPAYNYISSASVIGPSMIHIELITTATGSDIFYTLERQQWGSDDWDELETINILGGTQYLFKDSIGVNTHVFNYGYRAIVTNICGDAIDTTNIAVTILLNGFAYNERLTNAVQWTPYMGWDEGVNEYIIYRAQGLAGIEEELTRVPGNLTFYEDDVSDLDFSPGDFTYRIEAVSNISPTYPGIYYASSNTIRLTLEPIIWVPNAFVVDGVNNVFQPVISFANFEQYRLIIYSRWGDVIFDTTDINQPWDGFMNGKPVQEGVYVYFITIEDGKGKPVEQRGTVLLLSDRDQ